MIISDLITICVSAFVATFLILAFLAIIMRIIIFIFPEKQESGDPAVIAAITSTINRFYPNVRVTKIEELK